MSTNNPKSDGPEISCVDAISYLALYHHVETIAATYDALMAYTPIPVGETDTHAIAAQIEVLIAQILAPLGTEA